jgi:hypothetical protein
LDRFSNVTNFNSFVLFLFTFAPIPITKHQNPWVKVFSFKKSCCSISYGRSQSRSRSRSCIKIFTRSRSRIKIVRLCTSVVPPRNDDELILVNYLRKISMVYQWWYMKANHNPKMESENHLA